MQLQARPPVGSPGCSTARGALPLSAGAARRLSRPGPGSGSPPRHGPRARERGVAPWRRAAKPAARPACVIRGRRCMRCLGRSDRAPDRHAQSLDPPPSGQTRRMEPIARAPRPAGAVIGLGLNCEPAAAGGGRAWRGLYPHASLCSVTGMSCTAVKPAPATCASRPAAAANVPSGVKLPTCIWRPARAPRQLPARRARRPGRAAGTASRRPPPLPPAAQGEHSADAGTRPGSTALARPIRFAQAGRGLHEGGEAGGRAPRR
jgi:hypothetical protein